MAKLGIKASGYVTKGTKTVSHLVVRARAGTGKTTTLITALKVMKGIDPGIVPSEQQKAVWDAVCLTPPTASVGFVAFNKSIASELQQRVPTGCAAMTMHSMGFKAVNAAFPGRRLKVSEYRVDDLILKALGVGIGIDESRKLRKDRPVLLSATKRLVGLVKMNLTDLTGDGVAERIEELANHYDVELNGDRAAVLDLVPKVVGMCRDVPADGCIDFDDMVWLPVALNLPLFRYDLLLVDEAQDLNRCQQELAKRAGHRLILVGDDRQAIYGFAGADSDSLPRMVEFLSGTPQSCTVLPLTVTRRCGRAIVAEARKIVDDFSAHESNPDGTVRTASIKDGPTCYRTQVGDGDRVLCRANAPLVSQCFKFLRAGRKATILGRDVAQSLISTITKTKATTVPELVARVGEWLRKEEEKENAKRNPSETRLQSFRDRHDCIVCFCDDEDAVSAVVAKIERVFTADPEAKGVRLSSIHKAKGLEADRVFLLQPEGSEVIPGWLENKPAWEQGQTRNLLYVAVTRAIKELIYVS